MLCFLLLLNNRHCDFCQQVTQHNSSTDNSVSSSHRLIVSSAARGRGQRKLNSVTGTFFFFVLFAVICKFRLVGLCERISAVPLSALSVSAAVQWGVVQLIYKLHYLLHYNKKEMTQSVQALKKEARALLKDRLKKLTDAHRNLSSLQIFRQVEESSVYRDSRSIFCYLAMPQEVQTMEFIDRSLMEGKRIFVPKITGRKSFDMQAIEVSSMEDIEKFPKNNWGIPEPTKDPDDEACKHRAFDAIDLVIVPGMGFDSSCRRIGHGSSLLKACLCMLNLKSMSH